MTGKLFRTSVAMALASLMVLAPVAPTYAQTQAPAPGAAPSQAPVVSTPSGTPTQQGQPAQTLPTAVVPFKFDPGRDYSQPPSWWPHVRVPYQQTDVPEPQLTNSASIDQMIKDGKLYLSLRDAVELALQNNLDLQVQRYFPWIAEADLLRTEGGGQSRGTGNTTLPAAFTNQLPLNFDPIFTGALNIDSRNLPVNNGLTAGSLSSTNIFTHTANANFGYSQNFHEGTSFSAFLNTARASTTSSAVRFDPSVQTTGNLSVVQPLLNGFGRVVNERFIRVARLNRNASDEAFTQSIITDITAVEDDYWELVYARGNVMVQQTAVDLAQRLYDDNRRQVEVGTLAPIEIVRAQAQVATAQQALILAQTAQLQEQTLLMSVITKNPTAPNLVNVEIVPTDTVTNLPPVENLTLPGAVNEALSKRPDVAQARLNINADDVNIQATRNALLPTLNASAFVTGVGLGGNSRTGTPPLLVPGGLGDAFGQAFAGTYPEFEAQLALTLPIRNRIAASDNARALLAQRQDQTRLQQTINNVMVDVQNALITLQQDRPTVTASQLTRELQQQTLDAEQKKLDLGASTIFLVVTDQQALATAAAAEVRAETNLAEANVNLQRALGRTLEVFNISIADAKSGTVTHPTNIPGTTISGELYDPKHAN